MSFRAVLLIAREFYADPILSEQKNKTLVPIAGTKIKLLANVVIS
ncbi:hypothetical protein AB3N59_14730 [Leptospira sp. WS92.C1]